MGGWRRRLRTFKRNERGAAIVEFALVVPIFFLLVWGGLVYSRAYQRLNVLTTSLREGARYGATLSVVDQDLIRQRVDSVASAFGYSALDVTQVFAVLVGDEVQVGVTNYLLFYDLQFFFGLDAIPVSRTAIFRWERS